MHAPTRYGGGPPRSGRRLGRIAALAVFVLVGASCGGNGDDAIPPETLDPPAQTTASTASAPTTSSSATAFESTTTTLSPEDQVLEVHRRFMIEFFARDDSTLTLDERNSRIAAIAVDPLLARTMEREAAREAEGSYAVSPGYDSNVVEVSVDGETATVTDCSLDQGVLYSAVGDVLEPPDEEYKIRQTVFNLIDGKWFVSDPTLTGLGRLSWSAACSGGVLSLQGLVSGCGPGSRWWCRRRRWPGFGSGGCCGG